jgi:RNA polymerase sigma factor (sigma-70 family)
MANEPLGFILRHLYQRAEEEESARVSDAQLVQRFANLGEETAFEALVRRHGPLVWDVCRRVLHRYHDAEDVFQATFLVLARKAGAIRKRQSVASWLYGVALRLAWKVRASRGAGKGGYPFSAAREAAADPAELAARQELAQIIDEEVQRLPEKYRLPIVVCYLAGKTNEQAARELQWPLGTVKIRLARGRALLARRLARRGLALSATLAGVGVSETMAGAPLPIGLPFATARAAAAFAATSASGTAGTAAALARSALKSMLLARIRITALLLAVSAAFAGGSVWLAQPRDQVRGEARRIETLLPRLEASRQDMPLVAEQLPFGAVARMGTPWFRHQQSDNQVLFSADGKTLFSANPSEPIRLWDVAAGKEIRRFAGHEKAGAFRDRLYLRLSADEALVAVWTRERARLWDVATGAIVAGFDSPTPFPPIPESRVLEPADIQTFLRFRDQFFAKEPEAASPLRITHFGRDLDRFSFLAIRVSGLAETLQIALRLSS